MVDLSYLEGIFLLFFTLFPYPAPRLTGGVGLEEVRMIEA